MSSSGAVVKGYKKNVRIVFASGWGGATIPSCMKKFAVIALFLAVALFCGVPAGWAVQVRIASYNVYFGIDTGGDRGNQNPDDDYAAVLATMQRVKPDIVCFQELTTSDQAAWVQMAGTLGFPYYAFASPAGGTFAGTSRLGIWSKFPILASDEVKETVVDPTAAEMTRWPLHAVIQVPGALNPLHVFSVHNKSSTTAKRERMRRAFEIRRLVNYIDAMMAQYPLDTEYAVMGDFNDTIEGSVGLGQTTNFPQSYYEAQLGSLPATFKAGSDTPWYTNANWLLPYRYYPTDRLGTVGMSAVMAKHTGGTNTWTHAHTDGTGYRLDYLLFSEEIMQSAYGAPQAEVYNSAGDGANVGLTKYGSPLPANTSSNASDHRMVFADFHLIDEVAGMTPVGIISELVDHIANTNGNYVEICNTGNGSLDLSAYKVAIYLDKATRATATYSLSGTLAAGAVYTLAASTNNYRILYGTNANQQAPVIGRLDGNDAVALLRSNTVVDVYGVIGSYPGAWGYTNSTAVRKSGVSEPLPTWSAAEWTITAGINAATPGRHQALADADVSISGLALDPAVPRATNSFAIVANVAGNISASNFAVWAHFRISGGAWITNAMTNAGANLWRTPQLSVAKSGGDVLEYFVRAQFAGPGNNSPKNSSTNNYTFPAEAGSGTRLMPLFNEVRANGAGATDTNEFIELIAPAGTNLLGYKIVHYNGATNVNGPVWTYTFPSFTVPNDGLTERGGKALGLVVLSRYPAYVPNTDLTLPAGNTLGNGPHALILYDSAANIVDAVLWLANATNKFDTDVNDPGTVSRLVPSVSPNYLHVIGVDPDSNDCPQAPNVVLSATNWYVAPATPGTLNARQTNGTVMVVRLDTDNDGIPDDLDNCPDTFNPTQIDTDGDGLGDECDPDIDGDGIANEQDNCPYTYNPDQADLDGDGIGDECDDDIDGDGLLNDEDPDPYTPNTLQVTFEEGNKAAYASATVQLSGRNWVLTNAMIPTGGNQTTNDRYNGTRSCRIKTSGAIVLEGMLTNGIGELSFAYAQYASEPVSLIAQYRKGADWITLSSNNTTGVANLATNRVTANVLGPVEFRILCEGTKDYRASLDDIVISSFMLPEEEMDAQCAVSGATEVEYNGQLRTNDFIVYPEGIPYSVAYTPPAPRNAGSYTATVTIPSTNQITGGVFVFSNSLVITKATPSCALNAVVQTNYDGTAHTNGFTVTPSELMWSVAYSPENPPVNVGSYDATVTIVGNSNWFDHEITFDGAVVIADSLPVPPQPRVSLTNNNNFTVTWAGIPNAVSYRLDVSTSATFGSAGGTVYTVDFEDGTKTSFAEADVTLNGKSWKLTEALIGTLAGDRRNGTKAARVRYNDPEYYGTGIMAMNEDLATGLSAVSLLHGKYGDDPNTAGRVDYSTNGGTSWVSVGTFDATATNLTLFSVTNLNVAGNVRLRVVKTSGNDKARFNVDDIQIYPYTPGSSFVAGYSNRAVMTTSQVVTGLQAGVTYYFRVAAISTGGLGGYSPVASVTTRTGEPSGTPFENWLISRGHDPQSTDYSAEADSDGDGMTTWQEYLADTDPANSNSVLRLNGTLSAAEGRLRWTFPQSTARYYQVEYSTNLTQGLSVSNLGWGVPGRMLTNALPSSGEWFWGIRSLLDAP